MDTIHIDTLMYSGTHGVHPQEHHTPQRFSVSVSIDTLTKKAALTDDAQDVIDYQPIRDIIKAIIEGPHMHLIEKLADTIACAILSDIRIHGCTVTIKKLDIFDNGIPGITLRRSQTTRHMLHIPLDSLLSELLEKGFAVRHLVPETVLTRMREAALAHPFAEAEKEYGSRRVRQNFSYCRNYPKGTFLWEIGRDLEFLLTSAEDRYRATLFDYPLAFSEISAQLYPVGNLGISVHRDESRFKNIIAVCVVEGEGEFYTQDSRESSHSTAIHAEAGDIIFMQAPGFATCMMVPLHGVRNIASPRLSITYRQEVQ
jgi:dihydroneopterin aldolase